MRKSDWQWQKAGFSGYMVFTLLLRIARQLQRPIHTTCVLAAFVAGSDEETMLAVAESWLLRFHGLHLTAVDCSVAAEAGLTLFICQTSIPEMLSFRDLSMPELGNVLSFLVKTNAYLAKQVGRYLSKG